MRAARGDRLCARIPRAAAGRPAGRPPGRGSDTVRDGQADWYTPFTGGQRRGARDVPEERDTLADVVYEAWADREAPWAAGMFAAMAT